MKNSRKIVVIGLAALFFVSCNSSEFELSEADEWQIKCLGIKQKLERPRDDEIFFIAFGYDKFGNFTIPPEGFMTKLQTEIFLPLKNVKNATSLHSSSYSDKETGKIGWVYAVNIIEIINKNKVEIETLSDGGEMAGGITKAYVIRDDDGKWNVLDWHSMQMF